VNDHPQGERPASAVHPFLQRAFQRRVPVADLIGFDVAEIAGAGGGHAPKRAAACKPMGTLHGGILCDLTDAADGNGFREHARADQSFTTVELRSTFSGPSGRQS